MTSESVRLQTKIEMALPAMERAALRVWAVPDGYPEYLRTLYAVTCAAVPLLEAAAAACGRLPAGDPIAAPLAAYLERHAAEEEGHDRWLLADLAALGADPAGAPDRCGSPYVAELVGPQYYWMAHHHPVCLLGYIAVLEGYPVSAEQVDRLVAAGPHPRAAYRTLAAHADLDRGHRRALYHLLDELPLPPDLATAVGVSALHTVRAATRLLHGVADRIGRFPTTAPGGGG